jgi:hypothetical protein
VGDCFFEQLQSTSMGSGLSLVVAGVSPKMQNGVCGEFRAIQNEGTDGSGLAWLAVSLVDVQEVFQLDSMMDSMKASFASLF